MFFPPSCTGEQMDQTLWNWYSLCCWSAPENPHKSTEAASPVHPHPGAQARRARQGPQWRQDPETEAQRAETKWKEPGLWTISSGAQGSFVQAFGGFSSLRGHQGELWDQESEDHRVAASGARVCWGSVLHADWRGAAALHLSVPGKSPSHPAPIKWPYAERLCKPLLPFHRHVVEAFLGLVPCPRAPRQWSEGVLASSLTTRTPPMFCVLSRLGLEPRTLHFSATRQRHHRFSADSWLFH